MERITIVGWKTQLTSYPQQKENINQLIANYLAGAGYKEAADMFTKESGVRPTPDYSSYQDRDTIMATIRNGDPLEAIRLLNHHFPGLLEAQRFVKFQLLQLHLLELIREGTIEHAIDFAQTLPLEIDEHSPEVQREIQSTMALLAFDNPSTSPLGILLDQGQREKVARAVNVSILERANRELPTTRMEQLLKTLLWAQSELVKRHVMFLKMQNIVTGTLES
uniref:CTLH domain-containing protein n=1 Tax=Anopheles dirus TaxID=7168 RepID=A0A182NAM8_9DIPT